MGVQVREARDEPHAADRAARGVRRACQSVRRRQKVRARAVRRAKSAVLTHHIAQGCRGAGCQGQGAGRGCSFVAVHHGAVALPQVWLRVVAPVRRQAARRVCRGQGQAQRAAGVADGPASVARVLLRRRAGHAQLRQDGGQPRLPPDSVGGRRPAAGGVGGGAHRLPVDRRCHDAAEAAGLDPPLGAPRRGLLPHARRPVAKLGAWRRSVRPAAARRRPGAEQRQLVRSAASLLMRTA